MQMQKVKTFPFDKPIEADVTVHAVWVRDVVVTFNTKTSATIESAVVIPGTEVQAPNTPTKRWIQILWMV